MGLNTKIKNQLDDYYKIVSTNRRLSKLIFLFESYSVFIINL